MCLLAIAFNQHPSAPLIVASNRDEFYARPTLPMHWWQDAPILAGRDQQANGTWMGLSRNGRFAAVTNYRYVPEGAQLRPHHYPAVIWSQGFYLPPTTLANGPKALLLQPKTLVALIC